METADTKVTVVVTAAHTVTNQTDHAKVLDVVTAANTVTTDTDGI